MSKPQETSGTKTIRCAIYTRKSTEEGLQQEFNYIVSDADVDSGADDPQRTAATPADRGSPGAKPAPSVSGLWF